MARTKKTGHYFYFVPVGWDVFDPKVIDGAPIEPGTRVLVTKDDIDPIGYFRFILDEETGRRMSVKHTSLMTRTEANRLIHTFDSYGQVPAVVNRLRSALLRA